MNSQKTSTITLKCGHKRKCFSRSRNLPGVWYCILCLDYFAKQKDEESVDVKVRYSVEFEIETSLSETELEEQIQVALGRIFMLNIEPAFIKDM